MKSRDSVIDLFRFIAIALVTGFHAWRVSGRDEVWVGPFNILGFLKDGWVGVGLFFVISGYCMGMATRSRFKSNGMFMKEYIPYLRNRFLRIAIPYYVSIVFWTVAINHYGVMKTQVSFFDIITHVSFVHNLFTDTLYSISGVYWSLAAEMQFYLILPFIVIVFSSMPKRFILLILLFIVSLVISTNVNSKVVRFSLLTYLPLFIFGWVGFMCQRYIVQFKIKHRYYVSLAIIAFMIISLDSSIISSSWKEMLVSLIGGVIMLRYAKIEITSKPIMFLSFLGLCSYSIYLYNYVFFLLGTRLNFWLAFLLPFAVGIIAYFIIEIPSNKIRSKFLSKKVIGEKKFA